jgi:hypothetical protein
MGDAEVEKRARVWLYVDTAFVEAFCSLDIAFFEFLGALLETLECLEFCRVGGRGMGCGGGGPAWRRSEHDGRWLGTAYGVWLLVGQMGEI